ncbi:uroporphyrinogen-III synthase [Ahrensia sp. R2A130]|uniref:uroporphyrinogen-III synthase n=1 Tax=Ahrensia sp. R2A130 TaxID=744979 RepID=UPI0001E0AC83|nr:uroporphyrinogen-III synthase [Ahrensia sp. R2A130]EFL89684.1 uroporphyrinogen-III synthase [Ahrensia sp. R2A130]
MSCVLLTRPLAQQAGTRQKLEAMGHDVIAEPMLVLEHLDTPLPQKEIAGILLTSANAVPAVANAITNTACRILATGQATADAARKAKFNDVHHVNGNAADLANAVNEGAITFPDGPLLAPRAQNVARDLAELVERETIPWTVYRMTPSVEFSPYTRTALLDGRVDHVLLTSPLISSTFARLFSQMPQGTTVPAMLAMSSEIRAALPDELTAVTRVSQQCNEASLLSLLMQEDH